MSRLRRTVRVVAVVVLAAGALLVAVPPSSGQEARPPDSQGWWWKGNGGYPVPVPAPAPAAEEGQLVVAGAPDGATGIAAVRYTLAEGEAVDTLVFPVAPGGESAATAVILACQAGSGWTGIENGPWDEKPSPDCASGSAPGTFSGDEATFTFPVGPLQFGDQLNVVLVAGTVEGAPAPVSGSSFQVVLEPATLNTTGGAPSVPPVESGSDAGSGGSGGSPSTGSFAGGGSGSADGGVAAPSSGGSSFAGGSGSGSSASFGSAPVDTASFATPALPADEQGATATAPVAQAANPARVAEAAAASTPRNTRLLGLVLLLAAAAMFVLSRRPDLFSGLLTIGAGTGGGAAAAVATAEVPVEGIGRFARPRAGDPPSLT